MNKLSIIAAIAVMIIGVIAIWAASASEPYAPSFGAQIESSSMMPDAHDLPAQRITDFSVVFVEPVGP